MPSNQTGSDSATPQTAQPVGRGDYVVRAGDCVSSIAYEHGLFWETIWNHADNSEVKEARKSPHVLLEGDRLTVPEKTLGEETCATEQKHRFRRKGVPAKVKIRLVDVPTPEAEEERQDASDTDASEEAVIEEPADSDADLQPEAAADVDYILEIDGKQVRGRTDGNGCLEAVIEPSARSGRLRLKPGTPEERVIPLQLGHLDPIDSETGLRQRLSNLGFMSAESREPSDLSQALAAFQSTVGLDPTGTADDQTRNKLKEAHGT